METRNCIMWRDLCSRRVSELLFSFCLGWRNAASQGGGKYDMITALC